MPIGQIIGAAFGIITLLLLLVNGLAMLISPRLFFSLPAWLRAQGPLTEERYSSGAGAIQLRVVGAVFVGGVSWIVFQIVAKRPS